MNIILADKSNFGAQRSQCDCIDKDKTWKILDSPCSAMLELNQLNTYSFSILCMNDYFVQTATRSSITRKREDVHAVHYTIARISWI